MKTSEPRVKLRIGGQPKRMNAGRVYYTVRWSPDPSFRGGVAQFVAGDMREGLGDGIWPLGLIVQHSISGHVWVVCRGPQVEPPWNAPDDWLPPQKLERIDPASVDGLLRRSRVPA